MFTTQNTQGFKKKTLEKMNAELDSEISKLEIDESDSNYQQDNSMDFRKNIQKILLIN